MLLFVHKYICVAQVLVGNRVWMTSNNVTVWEELESVIAHYERKGQTVVLASINGKTILLTEKH